MTGNKKKEQEKKEGKRDSRFDWLFKENIKDFFFPLLTKQLNIKILNSIILDPQIHKTLLVKREVDFLCEVETPKGKELIHIEFQTTNDPNMLNRIGEYHGFLLRQYDLPIRHVVIYLGAKKSTMLTQLDADTIYRGFDLIDLSTIDARALLSSEPSKLAFIAPLCAMAEDEKEDILRISVGQLEQLSSSDHEFREDLHGLFLLLGLRPELTDLLSKIIDAMPITFDIVKHPLFQRGRVEGIEKGIEKGRVEGIEKGIEKGRVEGIEKGIEKGRIESVLGFYKENISPPIIAKALNISEKRVQEIIKLGRKR